VAPGGLTFVLAFFAVLDLAARRQDLEQTKFLIACGAIPFESDKFHEYDHTIHIFLRCLYTAFAAQHYRPLETIMTTVIRSNRNMTLQQQIQIAIKKVTQLGFGPTFFSRLRYLGAMVAHYNAQNSCYFTV
jgi:hypothetical protein